MSRKINPKELGFGTFADPKGQRFMNKDGSANVIRIKETEISINELFHTLVFAPWHYFFLVVLLYFIFANFIFASIYWIIGINQLGLTPQNNFNDWLEAFFFSTQCFTTVGFGRVNPTGTAANIVSSIESLTGLLTFSLATGVIYARFSRPRAQLINSHNLLIAPYKDITAVMFRFASKREKSLLLENSVSVNLGMNQMLNGQLKRQFYQLALELDKINYFITSWTVVHPIDENSPLYGLTAEDLMEKRAEFIVLFKATDETTSQAVFDRFTYFGDEIVFNARFKSIIGTSSAGQPVVDLSKISEYELV